MADEAVAPQQPQRVRVYFLKDVDVGTEELF